MNGLEREARCECPCHDCRGNAGEGYSHTWDDDLGIRHEDWIACGCENSDPTVRGSRYSSKRSGAPSLPVRSRSLVA